MINTILWITIAINLASTVLSFISHRRRQRLMEGAIRTAQNEVLKRDLELRMLREILARAGITYKMDMQDTDESYITSVEVCVPPSLHLVKN